MKVERKTDITVLKGMEWRLGRPNFWRWLAGLPGPRRRLPKAAADAALTFRTAVIQHSFVSGLDDMFHDAALWRAIVTFVRDFEGGGEVSVSRPSLRIWLSIVVSGNGICPAPETPSRQSDF